MSTTPMTAAASPPGCRPRRAGEGGRYDPLETALHTKGVDEALLASGHNMSVISA